MLPRTDDLIPSYVRKIAWTFVALLLTINLLVAPSTSQTTTGIKGTILHGGLSERQPVRNAYVLVHRDGGTEDQHVRTDTQGRYEIELRPGLYEVFISAGGYAPTCREVEVQANQTLAVDAVLGTSQFLQQ
jgi:hypothetical protein